MAAFRHAVEGWAADMVELDVHASGDGHCVVIHDDTVDRTTDGSGHVAFMPLKDLGRLDAGYRFSRDGGRTYPFRGKGITIPTIDEVLGSFPDLRFTVEVKAAAAQAPLLQAIQRAGAEQRVIIAGMEHCQRTLFHRYDGPVSASARQCRLYYSLSRLGMARLYTPATDVVQLPYSWRGVQVVTPRLIASLHSKGLPVHVWTVNDVDVMERLIDWCVNGIVTDRCDLLAQVLTRRLGRPEAPMASRNPG